MSLDRTERQSFFGALREERWDDHRYYHHSRINQSLHLVSACCFLASYVFLFLDPVIAVMLGWMCAMVTRQVGHFFFEPKGYDHVNRATHEYKERVKVGYNLRRKIWLLSAWAAIPVLLWFDPTLLGVFPAPQTTYDLLHNLSIAWLVLGAFAVLSRTLYLCAFHGVQRGIVWCTKILTDPFHDVMLYWKSPIHLLRGQLLDPMTDDWSAQQQA